MGDTVSDAFERRLPVPMLQVTTGRAAGLYTPQARASFLARADEIQREKGSRQALDYLIRQLGLEMRIERDESYFAEALNFHRGVLEAFSGQPEAMAEHIGLSHAMPGLDDELL